MTQMSLTNQMKDFFISYNKADKAWAEWIAWTLEEAGYSIFIQAWDFRPGGNFVLKMHEAAAKTQRTIAVLSEDYLSAEYTHPEWGAAFARDPKGEGRVLIPVRVKKCNPEGLHSSIIYIDLVGHSEEEACKEILEGLKERAKPDKAPAFPANSQDTDSSSAERIMPNPVQYPGTSVNNAEESLKTDIPSNLPTGIQFFTGREEVLTQLHEALKTSGATALAQRQAISGLGGIGKTQTAIEYARRHRDEYKALLWAVAESRESLISDFVALASVLDLPERNVQDQTIVVRAVKRWLETNADWLLILDNADDPKIVEEFLPENHTGYLLLTSRAQVFDVLGILHPVELDEMTPEDAREFLLRRTGRHEPDADESQAVEQLAKELDYLPLALEQAGAYIKELRGSFQDYLASYRQRGLELLEKGHSTGKYRKSVRTTWSLNFQQVEQASKASADLLRVSAFLNPDRIPAELFRQGAVELGPELSAALVHVAVDPFVLDEVLQPLIQYSLIRRDRESRTYDIHRLVQAVLRDGLDEPTERLWAERVVKAMARVFPDVDAIDHSQWESIERLISHAQACVELINAWNLELQDAAHLLDLTGRYLHLRARLGETELLYAISLAIREKLLGPEHLDLATSLHNQAWLYYDQSKYDESEPLFLRALAIREEALGPEHPDVANSLSRIGRLYSEQGRYTEATLILRRSLEIREKALGRDHSDVADSLSGLIGIYYRQDKYLEAEPLVIRALKIRENALGPNHYDVADSLRDLALLYGYQKKFVESESLFLRAITIFEKAFGINHPSLANLLDNLAWLFINENKYAEAEPLVVRSIEICETGLGKEHTVLASYLSRLALLYSRQQRYIDAEPLYLRAIKLIEKSFGQEHPDVALILVGLGHLYYEQRKYSKGEPLLRQAIPILKKAFGTESSHVGNAIRVHAALLKGLNRKGEAQKLEAQAQKIQAKLNKKKPK
jgi:tetratricopeptide (TPR) repeat protein